ncbi:Life-span regulatory factor [Lasiodiplodia theobromae]|uniref:Life-span regulatory factor n=1 Tax=Lasiodiplodia theobromae TaxID=45133 RepID=UPI0015C2F5DF|nr:Life-span regulatory factor [Lasiodiplodia theobromae]KAF4535363.1 Life-span regulatory factor [Lasiodiplodia theobromae]
MATQHAHHRNPSHSKRAAQSHPRVSRPALLKRSSKSANKVPQLAAQRKDEEPEDDAMAASFLNFCTVCEKQIIVPNNSILYCSESCRKKDNTKTITFEPSPPPTPYSLRSYEDFSPSRDIVPPRSPTAIPSKRLSYGYSDGSDDEAPEWSQEKSKESDAAPVFYLDSGIDNKYSAIVVTHAEQFYQHVDTVHTRKSTAAETEPSWILLRHPFNRSRQPLFGRSPDDGPFKSDPMVIQERTELQDVNRACRGRIGAV